MRGFVALLNAGVTGNGSCGSVMPPNEALLPVEISPTSLRVSSMTSERATEVVDNARVDRSTVRDAVALNEANIFLYEFS